jgi:hypothetical protein
MLHAMQRFIYKLYRKLKKYYLTNSVRFDTKVFFYLLSIIEKLFPKREVNRKSSQLDKDLYLKRYGTKPIYLVQSKKKVALDSHDYLIPRGAKLDNSLNYNFNFKLKNYFKNKSNLKVLDLGCSGGAFVRSFLDNGDLAIGLEGSDISKNLKLAEWNICIHHLFTADITEPFFIYKISENENFNSLIKFDCITAWEVLEHLPEHKLSTFIENITNHLEEEGIFVASVDIEPDGNPITGAVYHLTCKPKTFWIDTFAKKGLLETKKHNFVKQDYVRGHGLDLRNWDPDEGGGFHLVLQKNSVTS